MLKLEDVRKGYRLGKNFIPVLKGIDLEVARGEWVALLGASGSGKTTLLNLIGCLERQDQGRISYDGTDCSTLGDAARTRLRLAKIGFVFQSYHLLPELTLLENVRLAAMIAGNVGAASVRKAEDLLDKVGLGARLRHKPGELSGGEQQRAAIARALVNDPELILADEPTGNLDSETGAGILDLFVKLNHNTTAQRTIVMVTHDKEVASLAGRIVVIKDGMLAMHT